MFDTHNTYEPNNRVRLVIATFALFAILLAAMLFYTVPASAQNCYVGGSVNGQIASVKEDGVTFSDKGIGYGLLGGCSIGIGPMDIGARAGYDWTKHEMSMGQWHAAAVLGWKLNSHVRPYALAGVTGVDVDANFKGIIAGAGLELTLAKQLSATVEYNLTWLDAKTIEDIKVKPTIDVVRLGLQYKLF